MTSTLTHILHQVSLQWASIAIAVLVALATSLWLILAKRGPAHSSSAAESDMASREEMLAKRLKRLQQQEEAQRQQQQQAQDGGQHEEKNPSASQQTMPEAKTAKAGAQAEETKMPSQAPAASPTARSAPVPGPSAAAAKSTLAGSPSQPPMSDAAAAAPPSPSKTKAAAPVSPALVLKDMLHTAASDNGSVDAAVDQHAESLEALTSSSATMDASQASQIARRLYDASALNSSGSKAFQHAVAAWSQISRSASRLPAAAAPLVTALQRQACRAVCNVAGSGKSTATAPVSSTPASSSAALPAWASALAGSGRPAAAPLASSTGNSGPDLLINAISKNEIQADFLQDIFKVAAEDDAGFADNLMQRLLQCCMEHISSTPTSELSLVNGWISVCRFIADSAPQIAGRVVGQIAEKEAKAAQSIGAEAVQHTNQFLLNSLLELTPLSKATATELQQNAYAGDPRSPQARKNVDLLNGRFEETLASAAECTAHLLTLAHKYKSDSGETQYQAAVMDLLTVLVTRGMGRLRVKDHTAPPELHRAIEDGHGFALNLLHTLLVLMEPVFITKPERMNNIKSDYTATGKRTRLAAFLKQPATGGPESYNFVTETFYTCWAAAYTGLLPVLEAHQQKLSQLSHSLQMVPEGNPMRMQVEKQLFVEADTNNIALLNSRMLMRQTFYCLETAKWLMNLSPAARHEQPTFITKAISNWFRFVVRAAGHNIGSRIGITAAHWALLSAWATTVLKDTAQPLVSGAVVTMLAALTHKGQSLNSNTEARASVIGDVILSSVEDKTGLMKGLFLTYTAVDMVVGIDVDKEDFDKYAVKSEIEELLRHFVLTPDYSQAVEEMASSPDLRNFLPALLDNALFSLDAGFEALRELRAAYQREQAGGLDPMTLQQVQQLIRQKEGLARGTVQATITRLVLLHTLMQRPRILSLFSEESLARGLASLTLCLVPRLLGSNSSAYDVRNMAELGWDKASLVIGIFRCLLQAPARSAQDLPPVLYHIATDPEFEAAAFQKAVQLFVDRRSALLSEDDVNRSRELVALLVKRADAENSSVAAGSAAASDIEPIDDPDIISAIELSYQAELQPLQDGYASFRKPAPADEGKAAAAQPQAEPKKVKAEAEAEDDDEDDDDDDEDDDDDDDDGSAEYDHAFGPLIVADEPRNPQRMKRLLQELQSLSRGLPLHPDSAIFVRRDNKRVDVLRALITGPINTPYAYGCFFFDVYFPSTYPDIPPLLKFLTTGDARVRFNPNLYNDGKVCLSLLGTWHGAEESSKWTRDSTLHQVLVSIQSLIFVPEPMYNEPGVRGQGTPEGNRRSQLYNLRLIEATIQHAMVAALLHPDPAFKDVVETHFRNTRGLIAAQCRRWLQSVPASEQASLKKAINRLMVRLAAL